MKKAICLITLLCVCVSVIFAFTGCSEITVDDLSGLIDKACSQDTIGNTDYTLKAYGVSVTGNEKISYELNYKTGDHKKAKFTEVDETDVAYTKYVTSFYGASVPSNKYTDYWASFPDSLFKLEEATEEDYQDWYYYDATLYYDAKAEERIYYLSKQNDSQSSSAYTIKKQLEGGWEEFLDIEKVAKCDIANLAATVYALKDYIDYSAASVKSKGRVDDFTIKVKQDCPVEYMGVKLAGATLSLKFTNEKISSFVYNGKFEIQIAYGGAKITMPSYDNGAFIDYATQIAG